MPKMEAVPAEVTAISASWEAVGLGLTAQSPKTRTLSLRHMRRTDDTMEDPGKVLMIWNAGRMVWAVVFTEPDTMPSTLPLCTIMVPKYEGSAMVSLAMSRVTPLCLRNSK